MRNETQSSSVYSSISQMTLFQELLALFGKERSTKKKMNTVGKSMELITSKNPACTPHLTTKQTNIHFKHKMVVFMITMREKLYVKICIISISYVFFFPLDFVLGSVFSIFFSFIFNKFAENFIMFHISKRECCL